MGKWVGVGCLVLVGFSLLDGQYALMGVLMLAGAGLAVFFSVRGSGGSRTHAMPTRPGQLASARYDAREELASAERSAARLVNSARADAEAEGREALRAVMQFLSQEARWVA
ncbi:hypothetical protein [Mycobacteroides abscessus]|uniref:Uncharacterized protein n=1 Tax=Mycobacteroides abscessus subsp. abscessus TaxID=1185650 RepID=A0AB38D8M3_9MYCO|nr:hypothetical protein [Mycobacteroides abscessus]SIC22199.1 Uncharacterised protein [Mycobacteroides abscessus subsp. abscessus]SIC24994.1 Uncharacterised protein [Mycobacteroides abscessus subsp. abscessus]SIC34211.1 Uncharacterised protein [Mycobacteroides abscessus subsp. abscessus]SIC42200.1 Uncharacterised protein [Mycobacteroides abscessus subsp. abscessus]SKR84203.1 Uncharacterised protein [Mycobacteroides abscessus subsp. abscessus]